MALVSFFLTLVSAKLAIAEDKPLIASMNLCTDQLVLLLADEDQILSLSYLSHDGKALFMQIKRAPIPQIEALPKKFIS